MFWPSRGGGGGGEDDDDLFKRLVAAGLDVTRYRPEASR